MGKWPFFQSLFLLIVRLYWGIAFIIFGLSKLTNIQKTIDMMQRLHFPTPEFFAYVAAFVELIFGICLVLGLASRFAALILSLQMIVALLTAHYTATIRIFTDLHTFTTQPPLTFLLVTLIVLFFGPGAFSLDTLIFRHRHHHTKR